MRPHKNIPPWTLTIALPCGRFRTCEILYAADKTLTQRLLYMSVARLPPVRLRNEQRLQKYKNKLENVRGKGKIFGYEEEIKG